ncbi:MAG: hypothetical protein M3Q40_00050 [Pseudomonadota bacterium]|nr:hypothetical protein [Pseudomonadota bacterium]
MNRQLLPRAALSTLLVAASASLSAAPPAVRPPVRAELVDDATLSQVSGRYFGANMLVGLRVDLVSSLHTAQQGTAQATGSLVIRRNGSGFDVSVDTRTAAEAGSDASPITGVAVGGDSLQVTGIGQVAQIAGDGNRLSNITSIRFTPALDAADGFNGLSSSAATAGPMSAQITFLDGAMKLDVVGPGAMLGQRFNAGLGGSAGAIMQSGVISGNGISASNQLHLQLMTAVMPSLIQQQLGVQQALAGLRALPR